MQDPLFDATPFTRPTLPTVGEQKDIRYYGARAKTILNKPESTGMPFWSINPYVGCAFGCAYCYARYAHGYALDRTAAANPDHALIVADLAEFEPWRAFERRIFVKENASDVLRTTLRSGSARHQGLVRGEWITIGTATDPYQPAERRYRVTRGILEVLAEHPGLRITIITKSPLVTRDVDVLARIQRHSALRIHVSLITVDRDLARRIEPRAPTPDARLRAVRRLRDHGIVAGVNVMPILPGITDAPAQLDALVRAVSAAGANSIGACALRLQATARKRYFPFLQSEFPDLVGRYRASYAQDIQPTEQYRKGLSRVMRALCARYGVSYGMMATDEWEQRIAADETAMQLEIPFDGHPDDPPHP